jgi:hypothetical protein
VNWSAADVVLVPAEVVTVTSTVPAAPEGEVAVMEVAPLTVNVVAAVVPNFTAVAPEKLAPVMVMLVSPVVGPLVGLMDVTEGGDAAAW